jgi:uncharacterized metal-binding protein YceD (DUF177 family)
MQEKYINLFQFIDNNSKISNTVDSMVFKNIPQVTTKAQDNIINIEAFGQTKEYNTKKLNLLHLNIKGKVYLICSRCNKSLEYNISLQNTLEVYYSQHKLDSISVEEEEYDSIVGSDEFDLYKLIEEEILLSLPPFYTHEVCPPHEFVAKEDNPVSPFAILQKLKTKN